MINVIQAYQNGKTIEYKKKTYKDWCPVITPSWDFTLCKYRIATKKKTKKLYQFIFHNKKTNTYYNTGNYYETKSKIKQRLPKDIEVIKRLDYTKIIIKE